HLSCDSDMSQKFTWSEWKRPVVAIVLTVLCNVEMSILSLGEWPYMSTIDHGATASFFGYATAASKAGHAVFAFVFAVWAHKISGIKIPVLAGRCITLAACIMYIFVEFIPSNRRWWMLVCYVLFGVGIGTSPLLRSYIARVTTDENRSTAYALQNGGLVLSSVAQIAFSGLSYPGAIVIPPHLKLNIYSAPIWVAVITNVLAIGITVFLLEDTEPIEEIKKIEGTSFNPSSFSLASIKDRFATIRSLNIPWFLVVLVIFEKMVSGLFGASLSAVAGPMLTTMNAMGGEEIVLIMAIAQIACGLLASGLSLLFFLCKLGKRVSCRVLLVFSNVIVILGYVITYPFPFDSTPIQPWNETTRTGCNPLEYSWCDTQLAVSFIPFLIIMVITMSLAIPAALLSLDTIYSKIIGNIDQNVMQSVFVIAEDIIQIVGPIYGSAVYTALGVNYINYINGGIYILATLIWLAAWKWLLPYN
ncbi:hypothetical protein PENTCL1PPCAC_14321, partial [Pristionchus entomophagus]